MHFSRGGRAIVAVDEEDAGEEYPFCITLHLNARLQPVHRHTLEDVLAEMLERRGFGTVEGGGTAMSPSGEVCSCDIEVYLKYGTERALDALVQAAEYLEVPKGSRLLYKGTDGQRYERPLGSLEGLAVYLNGTELPDEVYQSCDVNDVIAQAEQRLGDAGCLMSWWEGPAIRRCIFTGRPVRRCWMRSARFWMNTPCAGNAGPRGLHNTEDGIWRTAEEDSRDNGMPSPRLKAGKGSGIN